MEKYETVRMMTTGQMKDLSSALLQGMPANLTFDQAKQWISNKKKLAAEVRKIFGASINPYANLIAGWEKFYEKRGWKVDFSDLVIPEKPDGWRHIFVPEGMTPQGGYDLCLKDFKCWKYCGDKSLNDVVAHEDRAAEKGSYVILVRDRLEADEENKNRSANDLAKANFSGITLTERLVFEDKVYDETKQHLDVSNWTYCTGSRYSDGNVPSVSGSSYFSEMYVNYAYSAYSHDSLRSRQTVS